MSPMGDNWRPSVRGISQAAGISVDEYKPAVKLFVAHLSLLVRGLYQDQLGVVFRASVPT